MFPETGCGVLQPAFEQGLLDTPWYMTDGVKDAGLASLCGLGTALDGFKGTAPGSTAGAALDAFDSCLCRERFVLMDPAQHLFLLHKLTMHVW